METQSPHPFIIKFHHHLLRAKRFTYRQLRKISGNTRPASYPYVSGDGFRALARHIHDEETTFNPKDVKKGDIVFVCNAYALDYMKTLHKEITDPYVLIVHNGDTLTRKDFIDLIDDKIIICYAQHVIYAHPKVIPIGIALENLHLYANGIPSVFRKLERIMRTHPPIKKNKILFRFSTYTNPTERVPALENFKKNPLMETFSQMLPPPIHLRKLMGYKFVASPPGNSIESCRTWEALELRTIPIVKDFVAYRYFVSLGLPMWIVKEWDELNGLTENDLALKYDELMKNPNWAPLRMDYWIERIKKAE